jgi:hypothetical protein
MARYGDELPLQTQREYTGNRNILENWPLREQASNGTNAFITSVCV